MLAIKRHTGTTPRMPRPLLLAARREDADNLFFQRRLCTEGDTEPGLEVKNFLDSQDPGTPWPSQQLGVLLQKALPLYE
jgi:predicted lipid carrier protein YhbT